jgi:hypothetical protein
MSKKIIRTKEEMRLLTNKRSAIQRERFPDRFKRQWKKYHAKLRLEVLTHYSGGKPKCACCGEEEIKFLTIDHINGDGKEDRAENGRGTAIYRRLRKLGYPKGYQVLCYNCNCAKGAYGKCPHKN